MSGTVHPLSFSPKSHHTAQCLSLWEGDMARIADWGQNGWPMLLQSVISMFDQPDYRDLTDRLASRWMGREERPREASTLVMKRLLSEVKAASEKQQTNAHSRCSEKVSGFGGGGETDWGERLPSLHNKNCSVPASAWLNTHHQNTHQKQSELQPSLWFGRMIFFSLIPVLVFSGSQIFTAACSLSCLYLVGSCCRETYLSNTAPCLKKEPPDWRQGRF